MKLTDFFGMGIIAFCLVALTWFGSYAMINHVSLEPVNIILTCLIATIAGLCGFFWGSSKGSKEKTDTINSMQQQQGAQIESARRV